MTAVTYGDLVAYALDLQAALRLCNQDKRTLTKWRETYEDSDEAPE